MQAEVQSSEIQLESRNNPLHLSSTGPPARRRLCTGGKLPRCSNNCTSLRKRMKRNASLTPHTKMTQINANRPKCKTWNNTNLRKHRSKSSWPWAREGFLRHETYSMSNNRKNQVSWTISKLKTFVLQSIQSRKLKTRRRTGANICKSCDLVTDLYPECMCKELL